MKYILRLILLIEDKIYFELYIKYIWKYCIFQRDFHLTSPTNVPSLLPTENPSFIFPNDITVNRNASQRFKEQNAWIYARINNCFTISIRTAPCTKHTVPITLDEHEHSAPSFVSRVSTRYCKFRLHADDDRRRFEFNREPRR